MRTFLFPFIALTSCGSGPIKIAADRCWTVSVGDQVEGTAILHAYAEQGCIECGAYLTSDQCPGTTDFAAANEAVDGAYDRIVHTSRPDKNGFIEQKVRLSGQVIANGATGKPMIQAERLELVE
ncbi:hypothetical protein [Sphingobium chungbukense]|uniref:hypothetical protein n=1 Tax=Sphingobium chungbukense TaxID=56193 RepID=UPI0012ED0D55|nr:hypothetical protein [Sphingobium chungbukense]